MSNEAVARSEAVLVQQARARFYERFSRVPTVAASAPGRVNLIGEHVDYCDGFVLPVAIPFLTVVVGSYNNTNYCSVLTVLPGGEELTTGFETPLTLPLKPGSVAWANYVKGVVDLFPGEIKGFDAVVVSDVPVGGGLSSSAALEVAFFTFLEALTGVVVHPMQKAKLCQKAEHVFAGVPCGIMDQYIVALAKKDHALFIDCRSLDAVHIAMDLEDTVLLVVNSNVKHQLTGSEYPHRRAQCHAAAAALRLPSLRSAVVKDLDELKRLNIDEEVQKRAKHVIEEIDRTEETAPALSSNNLKRVGELLNQSHESLSKLMEVSCPELDQLVSILQSEAGVYGARMTGGGFGGSVVSLVKKRSLEDVKRAVLEKYSGTPTFLVCKPSGGARIITL